MNTNTVSHDWLVGGGEMGKFVRAMDWSKTPLGPIESWSSGLRTTVGLVLNSNFPISLAWGEQFTQIYNDGYWPLCGSKHPGSMGQDFRECWATAWPAIGAVFESALQGTTGFLEDQRMFLDRFGFLEETFFTFSFSPIRDETGKITGLFHPVTETTAKMLNQRRTRILRDVSERASLTGSIEESLALVARTLSEAALDVPFVLFYKLEENGSRASLVAGTGLDSGSPACPAVIDLSDDSAGWPLGQVVSENRGIPLEDLRERFPDLVCEPYPEPPGKAFLVPISPPGQTRPNWFMIAGASARLGMTEAYRSFFDLLVSAVTTVVANATAYEAERKRAQALAELDQAKTTFFSNVSHEFRTPLTLILAPLEDELSQDGSLSPLSRARLEIAHRNSLRLLKLVNSLLDFARIESGRVQAAPEPTDLAALTTDLASNFRSACERAGLRLVVDCPPLPELVCIDREMWEKTVLNLTSNAFKFTMKGEISIRLRPVGGDVELVVSDTGVGIPEQELPHIFDRFHRVKGVEGRTHEGSGIGLALVRELVALSGGTIRVESVQGQETRFIVRIPKDCHLPAVHGGPPRALLSSVHEARPYVEEALRWIPSEGVPGIDEPVPLTNAPWEASGPRLAQAPESGPRRRVVWADDNSDMREYVHRLLADSYDVETAVNGLAALEAARRELPDLVVSDVMMPGLDGFGLLRELRADERTRTVPVILLSARAGQEARLEGLSAGADDYLVKPFSAKELLVKVGSTLDLANLRREVARRQATLDAMQRTQDGLEALVREQKTANIRLQEEIARRRSVEDKLVIAKQDAEKANRAKSEFLANMSHELRTPLNGILGMLQLLQTTSRNSEQTDYIRTAIRSTKRLASLLSDVLDLTRIEAGKMSARQDKFELAGLKEALMDLFNVAAKDKGLCLEIELDERLPHILIGDEIRVRQILCNLVGNAIKFTQQGAVRIEAMPLSSVLDDMYRVLFVVHDTGVGIPDEQLTSVFEPFVHGEGAYVRRYQGAGLGLAIAGRLTHILGGALSIDSEQGRGSSVYLSVPFSMPARTHQARTVQPKDSAPRSAEGLRILYAEDDSVTRLAIKKLLEKSGHRISLAEDGRKALQALEDETFDLILMDIQMPEMDGVEATRRIRFDDRFDAVREIPIIALTAYAMDGDRETFLAAGMNDYVAKPVEIGSLKQVISRVMTRQVYPGSDT